MDRKFDHLLEKKEMAPYLVDRWKKEKSLDKSLEKNWQKRLNEHRPLIYPNFHSSKTFFFFIFPPIVSKKSQINLGCLSFVSFPRLGQNLWINPEPILGANVT